MSENNTTIQIHIEQSIQDKKFSSNFFKIFQPLYFFILLNTLKLYISKMKQ